MLTTLRGYFNGVNVILDENPGLSDGQRVFVVVADEPIQPQRKKVDLHQFVIKDEKRMLDRDAAEVIREDRNNDRI